VKIAYFDCVSGASGDMLLGALIDAGVSLESVQHAIDSLGLPACRLATQETRRRGFRATKLDVITEPEHAHRHLHHITKMIDGSTLTPHQRELATRIFTHLAMAEAKVHGTTMEKVHFHEVGAVDSIADIVGTAVAIDLLGVDRIECSPIPTGTGTITIAHGLVSIPAPATAELLLGIPLMPSDLPYELTTPTGAAVLSTLAERFGPVPEMVVDRIGYGAGTRDMPEQANILRLIVGHVPTEASGGLLQETITILETTLDDVPGEIIGHCLGRLLSAGALDVTTTPVQMKKGRPGVTITILARPMDVPDLEDVLFRETGTLGVRSWSARRTKRPRRSVQVDTPFGPVDGKLADMPGRSTQFTPEYESCRQAAEAHNVPLWEVYEAARRGYEARE
jgi:uncharacterized protein (TIGR00299 family) protein